jgi:hypothetical protein
VRVGNNPPKLPLPTQDRPEPGEHVLYLIGRVVEGDEDADRGRQRLERGGSQARASTRRGDRLEHRQGLCLRGWLEPQLIRLRDQGGQDDAVLIHRLRAGVQAREGLSRWQAASGLHQASPQGCQSWHRLLESDMAGL